MCKGLRAWHTPACTNGQIVYVCLHTCAKHVIKGKFSHLSGPELVCKHVHRYVYGHACMHVHVHVYTCASTHVYAYAHANAPMHTPTTIYQKQI